MIKGIGCDQIEIDRIAASIKRHKESFLNRIFTPQEQLYCFKYSDSIPHYAVRFAAKEAVVKALGTGFRDGITWLDIEILNHPNGQPYVALSPSLVERFDNPQILITLSHSRTTAVAFALWQ